MCHKNVYKRKTGIGHVLRGDGLLSDVLEGIMSGKRVRGISRSEMLDELMEGSFVEVKRRAEAREVWKELCQGSAVRQNTNDDDKNGIIYIRSINLQAFSMCEQDHCM